MDDIPSDLAGRQFIAHGEIQSGDLLIVSTFPRHWRWAQDGELGLDIWEGEIEGLPGLRTYRIMPTPSHTLASPPRNMNV